MIMKYIKSPRGGYWLKPERESIWKALGELVLAIVFFGVIIFLGIMIMK